MARGGAPKVPPLTFFGSWPNACSGGNLDDPDAADPLLQQWGAFLKGWSEDPEIGREAVPVREVCERLLCSAVFEDLLPEDLPERESRDFRRALGSKLSSYQNRRFALPDGREVWVSKAALGARGGVRKWRVRRT